jgi:hypothetical protein
MLDWRPSRLRSGRPRKLHLICPDLTTTPRVYSGENLTVAPPGRNRIGMRARFINRTPAEILQFGKSVDVDDSGLDQFVRNFFARLLRDGGAEKPTDCASSRVQL